MKSVANCIFEDAGCLDELLEANESVEDMSRWFQVSLGNNAVYLVAKRSPVIFPSPDKSARRIDVVLKFGKLFWQLLCPCQEFPDSISFDSSEEQFRTHFFRRGCAVAVRIQETVCDILKKGLSHNASGMDLGIFILDKFKNTDFGIVQEVERKTIHFEKFADADEGQTFRFSCSYTGLVDSVTNLPHGEGLLTFRCPADGEESLLAPENWIRHKVSAVFVRGKINNSWPAVYRLFPADESICEPNSTERCFLNFTWDQPKLPTRKLPG